VSYFQFSGSVHFSSSFIWPFWCLVRIQIVKSFSHPLVTFSSAPCSQNLQLCYFFIEKFHTFFPFFFPPVSWQCVVSTNSCSSAEALTPTLYVHTILYQTETPTSEEVGITVGFRRRDSSSGGISVPSEDNHEPTAGTAWTGVEGMAIVFVLLICQGTMFLISKVFAVHFHH